MPQLEFPTSPTPGQVVQGTNGVDYTWNATVGVWTAAAGTPLTITNPGSISGTAEVGASLTYTVGTATGGVGPYTYAWEWFITPATPIGTIGTTNPITVPAGALGQNIYVKLTATDAAANTATAVTSSFPTPPATIQPAGITGAQAPTTIPGTASFTWADGPTTLSASGCIEFSVDAGANWTQSATSVNNTTTVLTRWVNVPLSGTCGDSAGNATITGTLTDVAGATTTFSFTMDRTPNAITLVPNIETTTPNTVTTADPTFTIAGTDAPSFIWGSFATTGGTPQYTQDGGTNWYAIPTAPGTATVNPGATVSIRFTTGAAAGSEVYTVNVGASTTAGQFQSGAFTVTVATAPFPGFSTTPAGGPNASPDSTALAGPSLYGTAVGAAWTDGTTNINTTGSLQYNIGAGAWGQAAQTVNNSDIVSLRWDPTAMVAVDGTALNGTLTDGTYTNAYTVTVTNQPGAYTWTDVPAGAGGSAVSTLNTSNVVNISGINAPAEIIYTPDGTNPLTSVEAAIAGGGWNPIPTTSPGLVINPADSAGTTATTLQIRGITGPNLNTAYKITTKIGDGTTWVTDEWSVGTVAASPSVTAPNIVTPAAGATGQGTASGITITADPYSASGGAGAQTSSTWEVYKNSYPLQSANTISGVTQNARGAWVAALTGTYNAVGYGNGVYLAVNNSGNTQTSSDGINWSPGGNVGTGAQGQFCVAFDGTAWYAGCLIAGGGTQRIYKSTTNGASWSQVYTSAGGANQINFLVAGAGKVVAGWDDGNIARSINGGVSWSYPTITLNGGTTVENGAYLNSLFFLVGGQKQIWSSSDGTNFTRVSTGVAGDLSLASIAYGAGKYVVGSSQGGVLTSPDGIVWTQTGSSGVQSLYQMCFAGGGFVAGTGGLNVGYSADGDTWTFASDPAIGSNIRSFAVGSVLVAGTNAQAAYNTTPSGSTTLAIAGCQTEGFLVGDTVVSGSGAAAGPATILSLDNTQVTVTSSTGWVGTNTQTLARATSSYTAVTGSPFTVSSGTLTSLTIPKPPLEANTKYWVRAQYTSAAVITTSPFGGWSDFTTGALLPGTATLLSNPGGGSRGPIAYSGSTYVMSQQGASSGATISSADLVTWTPQAALTGTLSSVVPQVFWTGSTFLASGAGAANNMFASTTGGAPWSATLSSGGTLSGGFAQKSATEILGGVGSTTLVISSTTNGGTSWTTNSFATIVPSGSNLIYFGGYYVVGGSDTSLNQSFYWSTTGGAWFSTSSGGALVRALGASPTAAVAVGTLGGNTVAMRSTTGNSWSSPVTLTGAAQLAWVAYGNGLFMAVGQSGNVWVSTDDGVTWINRTASVNLPTKNFAGVAYLAGKWIVNTAPGEVYQIS